MKFSRSLRVLAAVLLPLLSLGVSSSYLGSVELGEAQLGAAFASENASERPPGSLGLREREKPTRIASASLLSDELLEGSLPWERWASVSYIVDWPSATTRSHAFPGEIPRSYGESEDLLLKRADLYIFSTYNQASVYFRLSNLGKNVHVVHAPRDFDELFAEWSRLLLRVGIDPKSSQPWLQAQARRTRLQTLAKRLKLGSSKRPRALLLQGDFSYGPGTLQGACLQEAGFENVLSLRQSYSPQLNHEMVLQLAPEVIFVASDVPAPQAVSTIPGFAALDEWSSKRRVFAIPGVWMAAISQHALLACESYTQLVLGQIEKAGTQGT